MEFQSLPARTLRWLADSIYHHRRWYLYSQAALMLVCILYTTGYFIPGKQLLFLTSRNDLVGGEKEYHKNYLKFKDEFPNPDDLVVVVESENREKNRQFVERLGAKLDRQTNLFAGVFYKGDLKLMGPKALLFLTEEELKGLRQTFAEYRPFLIQFTQATNLITLFDLVNTQFRTAKREDNDQNKALVKALPALVRIMAQATDALGRSGRPPSPGVTSLFEGGPEEEEDRMYITFGKGRIYLVTAHALREDLNGRAVERMRELIEQTQHEVPGLNTGLTGEPVLEVDEMAQSQDDTTVATIVSLLLVALIFIYGYHETGRPLKATICLLVGLAYTMGFTTLTVGHLNILTITFVPILIGLAIDFGVHLITRYEEELRQGKSEREALEKAMVNTGLGIFTGAFTTAGAFFAMAATDFKGIQEMGIICGGGLLVCLVPMMTLLPVLILRGKQNIIDQEKGAQLTRQALQEVDRRARIENVWLRRPVITGCLTMALCGLAILSARRTHFDYNLLNMQSAGLPAVIFQDKLIASSSKSVLFAAVLADSVTQATNLEARLKALPSVGSIDSMTQYLAEEQSRELALLREIKREIAPIHFHPADPNPVNISELRQSLLSLNSYLRFAEAEVKKDEPDLYQQLVALRKAVGKMLDQLLLDDRTIDSLKLAAFQQALFNDVRETFEHIKNQDDSGPLRVNDLPVALRERFVGVSGRLLLQVYPKKDVWNREAQEEFVQQLRTVDPKVPGTPVQLLEYTTLLKKSFEEAAVYSLIAIALLVFIHFRSVSCVILSLLPVAIGFLWLLGLMGHFGLPFNPANIMTLPLVIGVGVTNGIHILNRFAEEQQPSILAKSTGKAVIVSALTTIAGFGSLILAKHRGIESLGWMMATGTTTCMVAGITFLPALLNLLAQHGWSIKKTQRDNAQPPLGREEPR
jgi:hopanoid biosynthesis associated RND transporter like protein HpnN